MEKLFRVRSKMEVLEYGDVYFFDVVYSFFADRSKPAIPYQEGIENYDKNKKGIKGAEKALNELFTKSEAEMLCEYLKTFDMECQINEVAIPLSVDSIGYEAVAMESQNNCFSLKDKKNKLPFKVAGFCDLRDLDEFKFPLPMQKIKKLYRIDDTIIYELKEGGFRWADFGGWRELNNKGRFYIYMRNGNCMIENNLLKIDGEVKKVFRLKNKTFEEIYKFIDNFPKWNITDYYVELDDDCFEPLEPNVKNDVIHTKSGKVAERKKTMKVVKKAV